MTVGSTLPPVERRVLRQDILLGLRSGILNGEIAPGTRLLEIPLATELGVSPGHLARSFKREMGVSLVDYRNRLRLDRFFESIQRRGGSGNLLDAALEAGFGSYAQFHRVYRKFLGTTPRDVFASARAAAPESKSVESPALEV